VIPRAERAAHDILQELDKAICPIDVDTIAELLEIQVVFESLPYETSSVLIREADGRRVIGVNARHPKKRQRFSIAHEIGHATLHLADRAPDDGEAVVSRPLEVLFRDGLASSGTSRTEIEANTFAANLLMPRPLVQEAFRECWEKDSSRSLDDVLDDLANNFDVSSQAMRYRLVNLGLIDPT
jgi:Zn-dependent peptidase ImmA (M78 family)